MPSTWTSLVICQPHLTLNICLNCTCSCHRYACTYNSLLEISHFSDLGFVNYEMSCLTSIITTNHPHSKGHECENAFLICIVKISKYWKPQVYKISVRHSIFFLVNCCVSKPSSTWVSHTPDISS